MNAAYYSVAADYYKASLHLGGMTGAVLTSRRLFDLDLIGKSRIRSLLPQLPALPRMCRHSSGYVG